MKFKPFALALAAVLAFTSCDKDPVEPSDPNEPNNPGYEVPETYNFENVDYSGQETRLAMFDEMIGYMKTANDGSTKLNEQKLLNMFSNTNAPFADAALNSSGKNLKDKTFSEDQQQIEDWLVEHARISGLGTTAMNGQPGTLTNASGARTYLVNENGLELTQVAAKTLMGAMMYYQATGVYLSDDKIGAAVDNETVVPGEGTAMEHHWDEAFGYFGAPVDFPANLNDLGPWAGYSDELNATLGSSQPLMDAFIKGRAAISNDDMEAKEAAVAEVSEQWERLVAAAAVHYMNAAKRNFADDAMRSHTLSEGIGFINSLFYNPNRKITEAELDEVKNRIGDNLWEVTVEDLNAVRDQLSAIYDLEDIKEQL